MTPTSAHRPSLYVFLWSVALLLVTSLPPSSESQSPQTQRAEARQHSQEHYAELRRNYEDLLHDIEQPLTAPEAGVQDVADYDDDDSVGRGLSPSVLASAGVQSEDASPRPGVQRRKDANLLVAQLQGLLEHIKKRVLALSEGRKNLIRLRQLYASTKRGPANNFVRIGRAGGERRKREAPDRTSISAEGTIGGRHVVDDVNAVHRLYQFRTNDPGPKIRFEDNAAAEPLFGAVAEFPAVTGPDGESVPWSRGTDRAKRHVRVGRLPLSVYMRERDADREEGSDDDDAFEGRRSAGYRLTRTSVVRAGKRSQLAP